MLLVTYLLGQGLRPLPRPLPRSHKPAGLVEPWVEQSITSPGTSRIIRRVASTEYYHTTINSERENIF